jgi:zinc/manganese transport system substrate-binding protein
MVVAAAIVSLAGCAGGSAHGTLTSDGRIRVVAAENEYGNVAAQVGGPFVAVTSIESNPDTDPHTYEVNASVARSIGSAGVVIQNGLGYDSFMDGIEAASSPAGRRVIDVQKLLGRPASTPNPHLWYDPATMPAVAGALASDLAALQPAHAGYFRAAAARFDASLSPWLAALAAFRSQRRGTPVATTEPVADYMLAAAGADNLTPFSFQADIMNGVDPAPQDVTIETSLLRDRRVRVLVYNQQVTDSVTAGFVKTAERAGVPVLGVYETMPGPGYDYQSWMLAEVNDLRAAVASGRSAPRL